jgi:hypothetical protein
LELNIPEHTFVTVGEFVEIARKYWSDVGWVFRGQDNIEWPLVPKVGRDEFFDDPADYWKEKAQKANDLGHFNRWREEAVAFCDSLPENDFECLAFAQHYGLATRLLDWTTNPLVALFFAVEEQGETDGVVFCHLPWWIIKREKLSIYDPMDRVALLISRPFDRRIVAQGGVFTYHYEVREPLKCGKVIDEAERGAPEGVDLVRIRVSAPGKSFLQRQLGDLGISRKSLFPDLEGLSAFVNWNARRSVDRRKRRDIIAAWEHPPAKEL